jgi:hypothetical protein
MGSEACSECTSGRANEERTGCECGPGFGNEWVSGVLPETTGVRLRGIDGEIASFEEGGEISGRLEYFYDGRWGTVCDDPVGGTGHLSWGGEGGQSVNEVACRQLGDELGYTLVDWGEGITLWDPYRDKEAWETLVDLDPWLGELGCLGNERDLGQCKHVGFGMMLARVDGNGARVCWAGGAAASRWHLLGVTCWFAEGGECQECAEGEVNDEWEIGPCT